MLEAIKLLRSEFDLKDIKQQPILNASNEIVAYHCYAQNNLEQTVSGGTHANKEVALRICVAELLERYFFQKICKDRSLADEFLATQFPSTSGFAAGFDRESTKFRAICEGVERWAWSQWIDFQYHISVDSHSFSFTSVTAALINDFDSHKMYRRDIQILVNGKSLELALLIFLGFKNNGVFAGSRVSTHSDELLEHAVIEANRNLKNARFFEKYPDKIDRQSFFDTRLIYFSKNASAALSQIENATKSEWPAPEMLLLREFETNIDSVYIWRCLMKNFVGWHLGDEKRFVY